MQHPSLIERSVGATLRAYSKGQVTPEEAELDLVELIANQLVGKTDFGVAVIGYYVRSVLKSLSDRRLDFTEAFETFVDAAIAGAEGDQPVSSRLAQPFCRRNDQGSNGGLFA